MYFSAIALKSIMSNQIPEPLEELAKAGKYCFLLGRTVLAEAEHRRKNLRIEFVLLVMLGDEQVIWSILTSTCLTTACTGLQDK